MSLIAATGNNEKYPICAKLQVAQVVEFFPDSTELNSGILLVTECCDYYFNTELTKAELHQLADELHAIAEVL